MGGWGQAGVRCEGVGGCAFAKVESRESGKGWIGVGGVEWEVWGTGLLEHVGVRV